jgi:uncharacterized protein (TIGR03435 family)
MVLTGPLEDPMKGGPGTSDPERIEVRYLNFSTLLLRALGGGPETNFPGNRLERPSWMETQRYDIVAKVPAGATKAQANEMMLNLLKERFHPKFHREMRPFDGYQLTIAKGGLRLKESPNPEAPPAPAGSFKIVENDFPRVEPGFTIRLNRLYQG